MTMQWANWPFALITETGALGREGRLANHPAVSMAQHMAQAHNIILRSMNASFNQCLSVRPGTIDADDFLCFNQCIYEMLKLHHDVEDEYMFPEIERLTGVSGIMDQNIQEHKDFHDDLEEFRKYVFSISASGYNGETLKSLLEAFGRSVEKHFHNEIPTLLELHSYDASRVQAVLRGLGKQFARGVDKYRLGPLLFGCSDTTFVLDGETIQFPSLPFFAPYIIKYFFEPRYAGSWRFNPSDSFGRPRALQFLNQVP